MSYLFIQYPKCSTCQKAKQWLEDHGVSYTARHIVEENPTEQELSQWIARSGLPIKRFFNTSGLKYKALELKDKLPLMSEEEMVALLATDGMLVKRPLLIGEDTILVGFKPQEWESIL
ncbi:arsenate reductase family protein [Merdimmobilis hominis]|jgi:arsenate reductase|uniref:Regulatory protein MgsR n=1 Tax=uncultured Anaerotruncus sp. TaxID=905011 RepID=A0A6N2TUF3_9FIRM|nr:arsenate reductase family protein [Merdimmobilis hominis]MCD4835569.1 arsenate reductase family protein [Merdimmobilis hominis]PWL59460.1 MAG: arsenate reductase family protein [Oscillospiraceae bacterium]